MICVVVLQTVFGGSTNASDEIVNHTLLGSQFYVKLLISVSTERSVPLLDFAAAPIVVEPRRQFRRASLFSFLLPCWFSA